MPRVAQYLPPPRCNSPQGLHPAIKQLIEALARDAVRREDRRAREATPDEARAPDDK
jgi:hypothetical protein